VHTRALAGHVTWSIRPQAGGTSGFDPDGSRVFGPTRAGAGVVVRYQTSSRLARLLLPQTGQQLRWGRLDVHLVRDDRGTLRQRAVAVIPFHHYLRGLAEMPGSFANEAPQAQAIAARSYALAAVHAPRQSFGAGSWDGCRCAAYGTVRDQAYAGYAKETGYWGPAGWRRCATGSLVVRYGSRVVPAFSSSSGGYTSSNSQWGSAPLPWFPSRSDDPYDRGGAATPTRTSAGAWTCPATLGARLGVGTALAVAETKVPSWGGRVWRTSGTAPTGTGRWSATGNGDGVWTPGTVRAGVWSLRNSNTTGRPR
jgi:peptidoglycan hydrolase-like amidase